MAREAVLPEHEFTSPVDRRVYELRHSCLTTWLNNGVPPAQVADSAGNSFPRRPLPDVICRAGDLGESKQAYPHIDDTGALVIYLSDLAVARHTQGDRDVWL